MYSGFSPILEEVWREETTNSSLWFKRKNLSMVHYVFLLKTPGLFLLNILDNILVEYNRLVVVFCHLPLCLSAGSSASTELFMWSGNPLSTVFVSQFEKFFKACPLPLTKRFIFNLRRNLFRPMQNLVMNCSWVVGQMVKIVNFDSVLIPFRSTFFL